MSVRQMSLVYQHEFPHNKQSIMMSLADHANDEGKMIFPSVALTAWKTGYSSRQVQRIMQELINDGVLSLVKGSGFHRANEYEFDWLKAKLKTPFKRKGDNLTPITDEGVTFDALKGDKFNKVGDIAMSSESSVKPSFLNHNKINYKPDLHEIWERLIITYQWANTRYKEVLPIEKEKGVLTLLVEDDFMRDWLQARITAPGILNPIKGAYKDFNLEIKIVTLEEL